MKNNFLPDMYVKNIFSINYEKLKNKGFKTLVFDFDNTIVEPNTNEVSNETIELFNKIKKDFNCIVLTNTIKGNKIKRICNILGVNYIYFSLKPTLIGFKRAMKYHDSKKEEICMIGDQYFTDLKGAKKAGYFSILLDPIGPHEGLHTKLNRIKERKIYKELNFKKGKYYD